MGLAVRGKTFAKLFENAAQGMVSLLYDPKKISTSKSAPIAVRAESWESLLVCWLNEVLFRIAVKGLRFKRFKVTGLQPFKLKAQGFGKKSGRKEKNLAREIKAATYYNLKIKKEKSGYFVRIVLDI